ncbi:NAD-dependent protein deacetylase HST1-like [Camellia sinensis]|uniref:NAD-dependent protein deacetylase HST1-like n=1 Tax=Camellia sinensis TaxID=4442 RepID=UPI0010366AFC|nr:NAD-dependent protein deacetylase HST1-like [Camellia sinensis]
MKVISLHQLTTRQVTTAQFSEESDEELDDTEEEQKEDAENTEEEEQEDAEKEDAEEEEQKVQEQTFRSNMVTIVKLLQHIKLRNEHINGLMKTPFWALFDTILKNKMNCKQCRKYDDISLKIIQTY